MLKTNNASNLFSYAALIKFWIRFTELGLLIGSDMFEKPITVKPSFLLFEASILFCSLIVPKCQNGISLASIHDLLVLLYMCASLPFFGRRHNRRPLSFTFLRNIIPVPCDGELSSDCRLSSHHWDFTTALAPGHHLGCDGSTLLRLQRSTCDLV